jgi:hypothetical protein
MIGRKDPCQYRTSGPLTGIFKCLSALEIVVQHLSQRDLRLLVHAKDCSAGSVGSVAQIGLHDRKV